MKLDLIYIEGEHDEVPGIHRRLETDEARANAHAAWMMRTHTEKLSVEINDVYSHLEVEAALCVWEYLCEITVNTDEPNNAWLDYRERVGSVALRHECIEIGKWVLKVYDLLPQWYRESGSYDWEIIPAIVDCLSPGQTSRDPEQTRDVLLSRPKAKDEYHRQFNRYLKQIYGITFEDVGMDKEDFLNLWFDPYVDPGKKVERYADKYWMVKL